MDIKKTYNIIYADPPWHFQNYNNESAQTNPENHYPTMTMKDIENYQLEILQIKIVYCLCGVPIHYYTNKYL